GARGRVTAIADQAAQQQLRVLRAQLPFDAVEVVFRKFEDREFGRAKPRDLPAQLRADRTAATGDQHTLSGEATADRVPFQLHRISAEQILDRDLLQFVE